MYMARGGGRIGRLQLLKDSVGSVKWCLPASIVSNRYLTGRRCRTTLLHCCKLYAPYVVCLSDPTDSAAGPLPHRYVTTHSTKRQDSTPGSPTHKWPHAFRPMLCPVRSPCTARQQDTDRRTVVAPTSLPRRAPRRRTSGSPCASAQSRSG